MVFISDKFHDKRLTDKKISINTKYKSKDNNNQEDDIVDGIILEKKYFKENRLLHIEKEFDSRIHYSYIKPKDNIETISCPNCGYIGGKDEFKYGCNHCGTFYNIDYLSKDVGTKSHYDEIIHSNLYIVITLLFDLVISFCISFNYIYSTSRTFNIYDIGKVILGMILIGVILFIVFYVIDGLIILLPIQIYKNGVNKKQMKFWQEMKDMGFDKNKFFNNFNYELNCYYYNSQKNANIIDYDIIDYLRFKYEQKNEKDLYVYVYVLMRTISFEDNKVKSKTFKKEFKLKKADITQELKDGINVINCHNCGASIDVTLDKCTYCDTPFNYLQEWYIID